MKYLALIWNKISGNENYSIIIVDPRESKSWNFWSFSGGRIFHSLVFFWIPFQQSMGSRELFNGDREKICLQFRFIFESLNHLIFKFPLNLVAKSDHFFHLRQIKSIKSPNSLISQNCTTKWRIGWEILILFHFSKSIAVKIPTYIHICYSPKIQFPVDRVFYKMSKWKGEREKKERNEKSHFSENFLVEIIVEIEKLNCYWYLILFNY